MTSQKATLYYDLGSPYAYLAVARAEAVLGFAPRLEPILVGGIFQERGHGSWAHTEERSARIAEIEARAERYGLPPLRWPDGWPRNTLATMRAGVWADRLGAGEAFAKAGFSRAFADGDDVTDLAVLAELADSIGLPGGELATAVADPTVKEALRDATARAWARGVVGVPSTEVAGEVFFGDDRLPEAGQRARL